MEGLRQRFDEKWKLDPQTGCWVWTAYCTGGDGGYGRIRVRIENEWKMRGAHRIAWELYIGQIPPRLLVCHHCDNPPCVNPAHLFLGTDADNMADRDRKERRTAPKGEQNGEAKLSESEALQVLRRKTTGQRLIDVAAEFGVSVPQVSRIWRGDSWSHLQEAVAG